MVDELSRGVPETAFDISAPFSLAGPQNKNDYLEITINISSLAKLRGMFRRKFSAKMWMIELQIILLNSLIPRKTL